MEKKHKKCTFEELYILCLLWGKNTSYYKPVKGRTRYQLYLNYHEQQMLAILREKGSYKDQQVEIKTIDNQYVVTIKGVTITVPKVASITVSGALPVNKDNKYLTENRTLKETLVRQQSKLEQLESILELKESLTDVEFYDIIPSKPEEEADTTAVALLSDVHYEMTVLKESVMYLNEYNPAIAKERLENFFINLVNLINHNQEYLGVGRLILGILGDLINGWLRAEAEQTNSMSPQEAISELKPILLAGLKYLEDYLKVEEILVIGIVGNHARTTEKMQHGNVTQTNYEYFLYKDLEQMCQLLGMKKIKFYIPKSSMAVVPIYNKKYLFAHGNQFRYAGGVGGIYPSMLKWYLRVAKLFKIDKAFIGHWHSATAIKEVIVNGSVVGYDSYAMSFGFDFEEPQQQLIFLNKKRGVILHAPIYLTN